MKPFTRRLRSYTNQQVDRVDLGGEVDDDDDDYDDDDNDDKYHYTHDCWCSSFFVVIN